jgi:hypothetical protein
MDKNHHGDKCKNKQGFDCWLQMIRTYEILQGEVEAKLQKHGLTLPQFEVISTLAVSPCTNQQELAQRLQVTKGNLVGLIDRLTERGWVERAQGGSLQGSTVPWVAAGSLHGRELALTWIESNDVTLAGSIGALVLYVAAAELLKRWFYRGE